ncbi:MAG TPA: type II secretion system protein [Candidatus Saccharimonadales bacterium]|nr:type II secretion system protein [Candidatus Saccharimonadales bacterium]
MNKIINKQEANGRTDGFTLIELLLYVTIVGTLLTAVTIFFATTTEARVKNQSIVEVDQQGTLVMNHMLQTIRNADSITAPAAGATAASLTLAVPTAGLSPTIFDLNGTTLQVKEGVAAAVALTNNKVQVSGLTFKNLTRASTPGIIQVSFTMSRINAGGRNEYDYQKTFVSSAALRQP